MKARKSLQKSHWAVLVTISSFLMISISCSSESEDQLPVPMPVEDKCEDSNVSLVDDIIPTLQQNCAISGCHVEGTGRVDFTIKENIIQVATQIRTNTESGFMPPASSGLSLTTAEKEEIFCWVSSGAKNN